MATPDQGVPHIDGLESLRREIDFALTRFAEVREGARPEFREATGLEDDGENRPDIITSDNVDQREQDFRKRWSWLRPSLLD